MALLKHYLKAAGRISVQSQLDQVGIEGDDRISRTRDNVSD
jgi:hypothetical protein